MEEFNLKRSEVKKAERFATNKSGETCFLAAWSYSGADDLGWADVLCCAKWATPIQASTSTLFACTFI